MHTDRCQNRGFLPLRQQTPSCLTRLESGAHYPQEYGHVFNSFNRKQLKCVLLVHFNPTNQNRFSLKRFFPIEHDLNLSHRPNPNHTPLSLHKTRASVLSNSRLSSREECAGKQKPLTDLLQENCTRLTYLPSNCPFVICLLSVLR